MLEPKLGGDLSRSRRGDFWKRAAILLPICSGILIPIASGLIRQLSLTLGDGLWAVGTNYCICASGATVVALSTAKDPPLRESLRQLGAFVVSTPGHFVILLGGLLGALQNVNGAYAVHYIGPQLMSATGLIGQILFSLVFDASGIFWTRRRKVGALTICGVLLAAAGCALYQIEAYRDLFVAQRPSVAAIASLVLTFCLGGVTCVQSGVGRKLREQVTHFRRAAALNYWLGSLSLFIVAACLNPHPRYCDLRVRNLVGLVVPLINCFNLVSLCLSPLWMSMTTCMTCWAGAQLICSSLLAHNGWLQSRRTSALGWQMWCGVALVLVGLVVKNRGSAEKAVVAMTKSAVAEEQIFIASQQSSISPCRGAATRGVDRRCSV